MILPALLRGEKVRERSTLGSRRKYSTVINEVNEQAGSGPGSRSSLLAHSWTGGIAPSTDGWL